MAPLRSDGYIALAPPEPGGTEAIMNERETWLHRMATTRIILLGAFLATALQGCTLVGW